MIRKLTELEINVKYANMKYAMIRKLTELEICKYGICNEQNTYSVYRLRKNFQGEFPNE